MSQTAPRLSPFGQQLRMWRRQRGLSQLDLAVLADTTPRHVSFIETGRSRPRRQLVLRLAACMDVPIRGRNALLQAAGLRPAFAERTLTDEHSRPFRKALETMLTRHLPYPACAMTMLDEVVMCNDAFRAFSPGLEGMSPEESVDAFFGGAGKDMLDNWPELAWAWVDRKRQMLVTAYNPRLEGLVERATRHLKGIERPVSQPGDSALVASPTIRVGDQLIHTFVTVMRFEGINEVTLSELRVELVFPLDSQGERFFHNLAAKA